MDPTPEELKDIKSIEDACEWVGVEDKAGPPATNFRTAFLEALGGPTRLRHLVAIPKPTYDATAKGLKITITNPDVKITVTSPGGPEQSQASTEQRALTPMEEGLLATVRRVCRLALGLPAEELTRAPTAGRVAALSRGESATSAPGVEGTPRTTGSRRVRIATDTDGLVVDGANNSNRLGTQSFATGGRQGSHYTAYTGMEVFIDQDQDEKEDWLFVLDQLGPAAAGEWLKGAPERARRDFEVVMTVVRQRGQALQFASEEMQADPQVVLTAVDQKESAMEFASRELLADREFVLQAVGISGGAIQYAAPELQADRKVVLAAIESNATAFNYAPEDMQANRAFVKEAATLNGGILRFVKPEFRWDKPIATAAITQDGASLMYVSPKLKADRQLVLTAVAKKGKALEHADGFLRADREVVKAAVEQDEGAIEFASAEIQKDPEFVGLVMAKSQQRHTAARVRAGRPSLMQRLRQSFVSLMTLGQGQRENEDGTARRCICC